MATNYNISALNMRTHSLSLSQNKMIQSSIETKPKESVVTQNGHQVRIVSKLLSKLSANGDVVASTGTAPTSELVPQTRNLKTAYTTAPADQNEHILGTKGSFIHNGIASSCFKSSDKVIVLSSEPSPEPHSVSSYGFN